MKVMHILTDSNIGGAGKLLYNISSCINRNQFEFVFLFAKNSKLINLFMPLGFKIYTLDCTPDKSFDVKSISQIINILKKENPQILHTHSSLSGKIALKLSLKHNIKSIYTKHCVFGTPKIMSLSPIKIIYRIMDNLLSDHIIAVAEAAKDELINYGVNKRKIKVIVNGSRRLKKLSEHEKCIIKQKLGIKNGELVVGISARLEPYKGHKYFLEAAQKAVKNKDNIKFLIMGDGSYRNYLEEYSKQLDVSQNVIFLGFVDDVATYVNIFDININCSIGTETSSLSISEGLSLGKPAIVSDFGGNPNMVKNGVTGYIIKKANSEALYIAIKKLKNDIIVYNNMSKCALKDYNERFSDIAMTTKYETFYKEIISKRKA